MFSWKPTAPKTTCKPLHVASRSAPRPVALLRPSSWLPKLRQFGGSLQVVPRTCGCFQTPPLLRDALCPHRPSPCLHVNVYSHFKTRVEGLRKEDALSHPQGMGLESLAPAGPGQPPMTEPTALCYRLVCRCLQQA